MKRSRALRFATLALITLSILPARSFSQSAQNYAFSTSTTASLSDMSGSTQTVGPNSDDTDSGAAIPIGFDVFFFGFRFTSFSASSNGILTFATFGYTGAPYNPIGQ